MKQTLTLLTLGVHDFPAMKSWYKEIFGWMPLQENDGIVFFQLSGGTTLALFSSAELAADFCVPQAWHVVYRSAQSINFLSDTTAGSAHDAIQRWSDTLYPD